MSGGHFDYKQYSISDIADEIENVIALNNSKELDKWGSRIGHRYAPETIEQFEKAVQVLRVAKIYAQRIDWLLSCDDGQEQFHQRLKEELNK
jgi:hypothetical protein